MVGGRRRSRRRLDAVLDQRDRDEPAAGCALWDLPQGEVGPRGGQHVVVRAVEEVRRARSLRSSGMGTAVGRSTGGSSKDRRDRIRCVRPGSALASLPGDGLSSDGSAPVADIGYQRGQQEDHGGADRRKVPGQIAFHTPQRRARVTPRPGWHRKDRGGRRPINCPGGKMLAPRTALRVFCHMPSPPSPSRSPRTVAGLNTPVRMTTPAMMSATARGSRRGRQGRAPSNRARATRPPRRTRAARPDAEPVAGDVPPLHPDASGKGPIRASTAGRRSAASSGRTEVPGQPHRCERAPAWRGWGALSPGMNTSATGAASGIEISTESAAGKVTPRASSPLGARRPPVEIRTKATPLPSVPSSATRSTMSVSPTSGNPSRSPAMLTEPRTAPR